MLLAGARLRDMSDVVLSSYVYLCTSMSCLD